MTSKSFVHWLLLVVVCLFWQIGFSGSNQAYSPPTKSFKVAAVEINPQFLQFEQNLPKIGDAAEQAAKSGAKLIVFPEMATTGYIYKDRQQILPFLDKVPGKTTAMLEPIATKYHAYIAVGIAEIDPITNLAFNTAALIGPNGYIGKYRKNELNAFDSRWASRGNLGYPVFNTELGKIALLICYDDAYLQSLLVPALRDANIIAYLTSSDRLLLSEPGSQYNHSTIGNIASVAGWIGVYIVASNRTDSEANPETGLVTHYDGGASIWAPNGKSLAQAPVSNANQSAPATTIYADIDPALYANPAKLAQAERRPELYRELGLYRAPLDPNASTVSHQVTAVLLQYAPVLGNKKANLAKVKRLLQQAKQRGAFNLVVLPENSLMGMLDPKLMRTFAETLTGDTIQNFVILARLYNTHIAFSMPEKSDDKYYSSVIILDNQGHIIGIYHKTHLSEDEKEWATPGKELPVFDSQLGRIGAMLGDEVRIPDITAVLSVKRADIIVIPSSWSGQYGGPVMIDPHLLIKPFPKNTMYMWYNIAKYAQSYTLVANYVGGEEKYKGCSALYSLDPVQGHYVPAIAPSDKEIPFRVSFNTLGSSSWWMNQQALTIGRRAELNVPLLLDPKSLCFINWKTNSDKNDSCWDHN